MSTWIKRDIYALFNLLVIALFVWLAREARRENLNKPGLTFPLFATFVALVVLLFAVLANVFGYVRLADLLTQGTLVSGYRALILYTVVLIGGLIIGFALLTARAQRSPAVRTDRERLARRLTSAIGVTMVLVWIDLALNLFAIREDVYSALRVALNYPIKIGSISFDLSNVMAVPAPSKNRAIEKSTIFFIIKFRPFHFPEPGSELVCRMLRSTRTHTSHCVCSMPHAEQYRKKSQDEQD